MSTNLENQLVAQKCWKHAFSQTFKAYPNLTCLRFLVALMVVRLPLAASVVSYNNNGNIISRDHYSSPPGP